MTGSDLAEEPEAAAGLCRAAHARLLATAGTLADADVRRPSRLPDWTIGHVLTHLARNAEGHTRRLDGALRGEDVPRYPGGMEQRDREIAEGAGRLAAAIVEDLGQTAAGLEVVWAASAEAGWPHPELLGSDRWPVSASPVFRLREVELHHVDLGAGYEPPDWPADYVAWELRMSLERLPERVGRAEDRRALVAWLSGRAPMPATVDLDPW